ncbi:hypothetical protein HWV62_28009 [Athelia sp. TMB]|nr:hypothetical protein HWV62_28009 [Athelia sp. TMB]
MTYSAAKAPFRASEGSECYLNYRGPLQIGMGPSQLKKWMTFYKTHLLNLRDQLTSTPSTDFLNTPPPASVPEDPLWTGTSIQYSPGIAASAGLKEGLRVLDEDPEPPRANRRRKLNASRSARKPGVSPEIGTRILNAAHITCDRSARTAAFPHASSSFVGRSDRSDVRAFASQSTALTVLTDAITTEDSLNLLDPECPQRVRHLISHGGYKYIVNDINVAQAFADAEEYVYAVKVQQPRKGWAAIFMRAENAFAAIAKYYALEPHRRGHFKTHSFGLAMGNGSKMPHRLDQGEGEGKLHADFLKEVEGYVRHFTASAKLWMPKLMQHYSDLQVELMGINSLLTAVFPGSPFCALTINMGPQTVCLPHRDYWNLAYGTCPIGVLGSFNHRTGGQLILHEPKLIIEVRRGDVMFIPSAAITHENAPISVGEERYSFTQYTAGGLFRYVWCDGRLIKELKTADSEKYGQYVDGGEKRWLEGWAKYSTMRELVDGMKVAP